MVDSSWDNSGLPPPKKGTSTGMKVLLGCGITALLAFLTCAVGGAVLGTMIRKDPQAFERRMEGFARGLVQKDWDRLRTLVDQLQTDEGTRMVYRAHPGLQQAHPSEAQFLEAVRGWRPRLIPLPAEAPMDGRRRHRREEVSPAEAAPGPSLDLQKVLGTSRIRCTYPGGARLSVTFRGDRLERLQVD